MKTLIGGVNEVIACPGSCGELFQGKIDGLPLHVTCPISVFSYVRAEKMDNGISVVPRLSKVREAIELLYRHKEIKRGVLLEIHSDIPIGKGMASSTADIASAICAAAEIAGVAIDISEIAAIAQRVEPTDGVLFPGVVAFDHHRGDLMLSLGWAPELDILVIDFGGMVDSIEFNSVNIEYNPYDQAVLEESFELVTRGLETGDLFSLGKGSTLSAIVNQKYLEKRKLSNVIKFAKRIGAYGINIAHSGTVIGVLVKAGESRLWEAEAVGEFPDASVTGTVLIDGGLRKGIPQSKSMLRDEKFKSKRRLVADNRSERLAECHSELSEESK